MGSSLTETAAFPAFIKALSTLSFIASTKAIVTFLTLFVVVTTIITLSRTMLFAVVKAFNLMLMESETADISLFIAALFIESFGVL